MTIPFQIIPVDCEGTPGRFSSTLKYNDCRIRTYQFNAELSEKELSYGLANNQ